MKSNSYAISGKLGTISVGDHFPVRIMGVINLGADSFYKDSVKARESDILETAIRMQEEGADLIDLGGRSTAPYRTVDVSEEEEATLISRALRILVDRIDAPLSVDTTRVKPAKLALEQGVRILNDPFGLAHEQGHALANLVVNFNCSLVIAAHESKPQRLHEPIARVLKALKNSTRFAKMRGVKPDRMIIDPGIGFLSDSRISNVEWNSTVLGNLEAIRELRLPILVGVSRKKFLGVLGGDIPPEERLPGSLSATAIAVFNGAHVIRTHDVKETMQAIKVASMIKQLKQKGLSR